MSLSLSTQLFAVHLASSGAKQQARPSPLQNMNQASLQPARTVTNLVLSGECASRGYVLPLLFIASLIRLDSAQATADHHS